jgi:hypothetical protein
MRNARRQMLGLRPGSYVLTRSFTSLGVVMDEVVSPAARPAEAVDRAQFEIPCAGTADLLRRTLPPQNPAAPGRVDTGEALRGMSPAFAGCLGEHNRLDRGVDFPQTPLVASGRGMLGGAGLCLLSGCAGASVDHDSGYKIAHGVRVRHTSDSMAPSR